jgi:hypothetical protein
MDVFEPNRRSLLLALVLALPLVACKDDDVPSEEISCFAGDETEAPEMIIIHRTVDGTIAETREGEALPLIEPPQGGRVMFIGARARNVEGCPSINISTTFVDECTGRVIGQESRDVLMAYDGQGWLEPDQPRDIANYSNLAACPKVIAERDVFGEPYLLTVRLEDRRGRVAERSLRITPTCAEPAKIDECACLCRKRFTLGDCPERTDGGVPAGTCADGGT